jgi:hypothetical protein
MRAYCDKGNSNACYVWEVIEFGRYNILNAFIEMTFSTDRMQLFTNK